MLYDHGMTTMTATEGEHPITRRQLIDFMQAAYEWGWNDAERELDTNQVRFGSGCETHFAPNA